MYHKKGTCIYYVFKFLYLQKEFCGQMPSQFVITVGNNIFELTGLKLTDKCHYNPLLKLLKVRVKV